MVESELKKWVTNSSKYLVDDRWLKLRADSCTTPEGQIIEPYYVFEYPDWVNCFVIDDNGEVLMVRHYRQGVDKYIPELVSGSIEASDATAEAGIKRELEEELGYVGGEIIQIGVSYPNPANQTNKLYSFIAFGGRCTQEQKLEKGETLHILKISINELRDMLKGNTAAPLQSMHLTTVFLALDFIKQSDLAGLPSIF